MWTTYTLRALSQATLIAALPMLRGKDEAGKAVWLTGGPFHALDAGIPIVVVDAVTVLDAEGLPVVVSPAVMSTRWHANLALRADHPQRAAIEAAIAPFIVTPTTPQRVWA